MKTTIFGLFLVFASMQAFAQNTAAEQEVILSSNIVSGRGRCVKIVSYLFFLTSSPAGDDVSG